MNNTSKLISELHFDFDHTLQEALFSSKACTISFLDRSPKESQVRLSIQLNKDPTNCQEFILKEMDKSKQYTWKRSSNSKHKFFSHFVDNNNGTTQIHQCTIFNLGDKYIGIYRELLDSPNRTLEGLFS